VVVLSKVGVVAVQGAGADGNVADPGAGPASSAGSSTASVFLLGALLIVVIAIIIGAAVLVVVAVRRRGRQNRQVVPTAQASAQASLPTAPAVEEAREACVVQVVGSHGTAEHMDLDAAAGGVVVWSPGAAHHEAVCDNRDLFREHAVAITPTHSATGDVEQCALVAQGGVGAGTVHPQRPPSVARRPSVDVGAPVPGVDDVEAVVPVQQPALGTGGAVLVRPPSQSGLVTGTRRVTWGEPTLAVVTDSAPTAPQAAVTVGERASSGGSLQQEQLAHGWTAAAGNGGVAKDEDVREAGVALAPTRTVVGAGHKASAQPVASRDAQLRRFPGRALAGDGLDLAADACSPVPAHGRNHGAHKADGWRISPGTASVSPATATSPSSSSSSSGGRAPSVDMSDMVSLPNVVGGDVRGTTAMAPPAVRGAGQRRAPPLSPVVR
jgi:hypothetical protein